MNATTHASPTVRVPTRRFDQITLILPSLVLLVPVVSFVEHISPLDTVTAFLRNPLVANDAPHRSDGEFVELGAPMLIGWMLLPARWRLGIFPDLASSWVRPSRPSKPGPHTPIVHLTAL